MFVLFFLESKSLKEVQKKVQNSFHFLHELNSPSPWLHPTKSANVEKKQTKTYFWKRREKQNLFWKKLTTKTVVTLNERRLNSFLKGVSDFGTILSTLVLRLRTSDKDSVLFWFSTPKQVTYLKEPSGTKLMIFLNYLNGLAYFWFSKDQQLQLFDPFLCWHLLGKIICYWFLMFPNSMLPATYEKKMYF